MPSRVLAMMASSEASTIAARRWATSNARLCSVTSRWTPDAPTITPSSSRIGATVTETGTTIASFRTRIVSNPLTVSPGPALLEEGVALVGPIMGKHEGRGPADDLRTAVAVHPLGGRVPARDDVRLLQCGDHRQ